MSGLVLSLFPGIDLLGRAFEEEGFTVVRGPDVIFGGDIRTFHPPAERFDGVIGGPPCQHFSQLRFLQAAQGRAMAFGNLIPEFERCVAEARPSWFLMENVKAAPTPAVDGYVVRSYRLNNRWVPDAGGIGAEQSRLRIFSFGTLGGGELQIELAALEAPLRAPTVRGHAYAPGQRGVTSGTGFVPANRIRRAGTTGTAPAAVTSRNAGRLPWQPRPPAAVSSAHGSNNPRSNSRIAPAQAVLADRRAVPVRVGGSGKVKATAPATVTARDGGRSVRMSRYTVAEAAVLQGLPGDFLDHAPFTQAGKLKAIANGVPIATGRAIARAVKAALA